MAISGNTGEEYESDSEKSARFEAERQEREEEQRRIQERDRDFAYCVNCLKLTSRDLKYCTNCGKKWDERAEVEKTRYVCPNGHSRHGGGTYCGQCGAKLKKETYWG